MTERRDPYPDRFYNENTMMLTLTKEGRERAERMQAIADSFREKERLEKAVRKAVDETVTTSCGRSSAALTDSRK